MENVDDDFPPMEIIPPRKRTAEVEVGPDATPLEFLQKVYTNNDLPLHTRMRAVAIAAPFCHPKLEARANLDAAGLEFATELEQRRMARGRLNGRQVGRPELKRRPLGPSPEEVSAAHMKRRPL